jgi:hypothetical protein
MPEGCEGKEQRAKFADTDERIKKMKEQQNLNNY